MNLDSKSQTKLYGLSSDLHSLIKLYDLNLLSNKILISGSNGIGKSTLAYHFVNYIFSKDEDYPYNLKDYSINDKNRSFKLIENKSHPNIYQIDLVDDKRTIEISQIREMINYANKSSFNDKPKFVLIKKVENLNINSINALLKIVEEPGENLFFLLVHDSTKKLLNTLSSRCITFKLNLTYKESLEISNKIINDNIFETLNEELVSYYISPGEIVSLINFSKVNNVDLKKISLNKFLLLLIDEKFYSKDKFIREYIFNMIQHYFSNVLLKSNRKKETYIFYNKFFTMSNYCKKYNLNYDNLFMELKTKLLNE